MPPLNRILLSTSVFLSLSIISSTTPSTAHALSLPNFNSNSNHIKKNDGHSAVWERDLPSLPHTPYFNHDNPDSPELKRDHGPTRKKRSLYSHINGDMPVTPPQKKYHHSSDHPHPHGQEPMVVIRLGKHRSSSTKESSPPTTTDDEPLVQSSGGSVSFRNKDIDNNSNSNSNSNNNNNGEQELVQEPQQEPQQENNEQDEEKGQKVQDELEGTDNNEEQTLIEPLYPSMDLFEEDGFEEREHEGEGESEGESDVWMVDEWEEDLEGEMDELMDWIEDDSILSLSEDSYALDSDRPGSGSGSDSSSSSDSDSDTDSDSVSITFTVSDKNWAEEKAKRKAKVLGSARLRERRTAQGKNDDNETNRFQRLFSESWLF
ncbi:hypothetical protein BGZ94_010024 [Podila epigama]|nr:hypothetical protein BGZ94_010024 [Podila epigama]